MHSIAKACAKGELTECGCDKSQSPPTSPSSLRSRAMLNYQISSTPSMTISLFSSPSPSSSLSSSASNTEGFEWGGCSDDLKFGRNISQMFIDRQEAYLSRRQIVRMVNLHNNEAGRQVN